MQVGFIANLHGERSHKIMSEVRFPFVFLRSASFRAVLMYTPTHRPSRAAEHAANVNTEQSNTQYSCSHCKLWDAWSIEAHAPQTMIQVTAQE